jgi:hypothetical protein
MSDRLGQLLRNADVALPPATSPSDVALRVHRRRNRKRRATQLAAGASALVIAIATSARLWHPMRPSMRPFPLPPIAASETPAPSVKVTLASLSLEAELHERTAARLMTRAGANPRLALSNTIPDVQLQRDRAALLLVYEADQREKQNRSADAIVAYRRAIELFPQTRWAQVARQRLKDIES